MPNFNDFLQMDNGDIPSWFRRWVASYFTGRGGPLPSTVDPDSRFPYEGLTFDGTNSAQSTFRSSFRNMHTFWRAIRRSQATYGSTNHLPVRVLLLTDSTGENVSQNYPQSHWVAQLQRQFEAEWPDVNFEFPNVGVGGRQVKNVLGHMTSMADTSYTSQATEPTDGSGYAALSNTGDTARTWPWTWMGPPEGVTAFGLGEIWGTRAAAYQPHLVITMFGLNEYSRLFGYMTYYVEAYEELINDMRSGSRWAASRPSIVVGIPYGDSYDSGDMVKRNAIAWLTRGIAEKHGCPILDGNRWYNILRQGKDPRRAKVYGEVFGRYMRVSRNDGTLISNYSDYWYCPLAQPSVGGAFTYISSSNAEGIYLRKRAGRDVDIACRFSQSGTAATGIARLFARVNPNQWWYTGTGVSGDPVDGYEARYAADGTLTLLWRGTTLVTVTPTTVASTTDVLNVKATDLWNTTAQTLRMQLIVRGTVLEVWTAVGSAAPGTGPAWKRRIRFRHLPNHINADEANFTNIGPPSVREDGWCGFGMATSGANTPTAICLTSDRQTLYIQWLDDAVVTGQVYDDIQLLGLASEWTDKTAYNADSPGGNTVNHMTTDGYEVTFAVPVGEFVRGLAASRFETQSLGWSGTKVAFTSNQTATGSIARSGTTATFTWTSHGYAVGQVIRVTCSGAVDAGYNVTHDCTVTGVNTLTATVSSGLAASEATVTLTTRNVEQILAAIPVPAHWLGLDGQIEGKLALNVTSSGNNKTFRIRFGTTGVASAAIPAATTITTSESAEFQFNMRNRGATNSQVSNPSSMLISASSVDYANTSVDTAVLNYLYITATAAAAANEEASLEAYNFRLVA